MPIIDITRAPERWTLAYPKKEATMTTTKQSPLSAAQRRAHYCPLCGEAGWPEDGRYCRRVQRAIADGQTMPYDTDSGERVDAVRAALEEVNREEAK